jgi:hypothetical protein
MKWVLELRASPLLDAPPSGDEKKKGSDAISGGAASNKEELSNALVPTRVDVFGELGDWRNGIPLERSDQVGSDGVRTFSREFDLPSGVYQYKLFVRRRKAKDSVVSSGSSSGGERTEWILDPSTTRTRSTKGLRNSIVVIDGSPEPWLFAPAPPWIEELDRGGLRILVGKRRSRDAGSMQLASSTITIS